MNENDYKNVFDKVFLNAEQKNDLANNIIQSKAKIRKIKRERRIPSIKKQAVVLVTCLLLVYTMIFTLVPKIGSWPGVKSKDESENNTQNAGGDLVNSTDSISENYASHDISHSQNESYSNNELTNGELRSKFDECTRGSYSFRIWTGEDALYYISVEGRCPYSSQSSKYGYNYYCGLYAFSSVESFQVGTEDKALYWVDVNSERIKPATRINLTAVDDNGNPFTMDTWRVNSVQFDKSGRYALVKYFDGYFSMWPDNLSLWYREQKYTEEQAKQNKERDVGYYLFEVDKNGNFNYQGRFLENKITDYLFDESFIKMADKYKITDYIGKDDYFEMTEFSLVNNEFKCVLSYYTVPVCRDVEYKYRFKFNITFRINTQRDFFKVSDKSLLNVDILNDQQINKIKDDYLVYLIGVLPSKDTKGKTRDSIIIRDYFGPYSGCYAIFIDFKDIKFDDGLRTEIIGGREFLFCDGQELKIYKDSKFYKLKDAYDSGLISYNDLVDLNRFFLPDRFDHN